MLEHQHLECQELRQHQPEIPISEFPSLKFQCWSISIWNVRNYVNQEITTSVITDPNFKNFIFSLERQELPVNFF
jgi:hypothetical protein